MRRAYEIFTRTFSNLFESNEFASGIKGSLNQSDFLLYGDDLVEVNKAWKWTRKSSYVFDKNLPEDKQYLVSEKVTCLKPLPSGSTTQDSWIVMEQHQDGLGEGPNDLYEEDPAGLPETSYRKYSLSITYDRYNETARFWLRGYNQFGLPLGKEEMLKDVPEIYIGKSVTVEKHPFTGLLSLTVHPCNQREIVNNEKGNFGDKNVLVNYLKMWSSVFPSINVLEGFQF